MWYEQTPANYAKALRYSADVSAANAARKLAENRPWSSYEHDYFMRQARRCRAMAVLCDNSSASRAGDVDFLGLDHPALSREEEDAAIAKAETLTADKKEA